jgi:hypothetical protein
MFFDRVKNINNIRTIVDVNTENVIVNEYKREINQVDSCMENNSAVPLCFEPTLQSKSSIFQNKNLSLVEKRLAMKFVTCYILPCINDLIEEGAGINKQKVVQNRHNGLAKQFLSASVISYNKDKTPFIDDSTLWDVIMRELNVPPSVQLRLTYGFGLKSSRAMVNSENVNPAWTFGTACDRFKRIALSIGRYSESR